VTGVQTCAFRSKALFYMAKDNKTGLPVLVLNTFEGRGDQGSYEDSPLIRDKFTEFARQYSRAVVGYEVPVYTGKRLNPIYKSDLSRDTVDVSVVGNSLTGDYYLDSLPSDTVAGKHRTDMYRMYKGEDPPEPVQAAMAEK